MFKLGPYKYASKEELLEKLKRYLLSARDGPVTHPILVDKLKYLLLLHPSYDRKSGLGVDGFAVLRNRLGSGSSFVVNRTDGSKERFSYKKCIKGETATKRSKAIEAFRFLTRPQIQSFRKSIVFPAVCAISGKIIHCNSELEIDHRPEFAELLRHFCIERDLMLEEISTSGGGETLELNDSSVSRAFIEYHGMHAILRPVLKSVHHQ